MDEAARQQGLDPGVLVEIQDDAIVLAIMHLMAPGGRAAVNEVIQQNGQPGHLAADLEALQSDLAQDVILSMPDNDFQNLVLWSVTGEP